MPSLKRDPYIGRYIGPIRLPRNGKAVKIVGEVIFKAVFTHYLERNPMV